MPQWISSTSQQRKPQQSPVSDLTYLGGKMRDIWPPSDMKNSQSNWIHTSHKEVSPLGNWIKNLARKPLPLTLKSRSFWQKQADASFSVSNKLLRHFLSRWNVNPGSGPPFDRSGFFEGIINFSWLWEWNNEMNLNKPQTKIHQMRSRTGNQWVWAGPCFWNKHHSLWQSSHSREHTS